MDGRTWLCGVGSPNQIVESHDVANLTLIEFGSRFDLGKPFSIGGTQVLGFEFWSDSGFMSGVVHYGPLPNTDIPEEYADLSLSFHIRVRTM